MPELTNAQAALQAAIETAHETRPGTNTYFTRDVLERADAYLKWLDDNSPKVSLDKP